MTQYHPSIQIIDSHTGGEPTRLVIAGGPDLGSGSLAEQRERFSTHFDALRAGIINEPRGSDVVVGALLCEPENPACSAGVIFFNNVGMLNMCGHGTIGLLVTLAHMGRIGPGEHRIETPVGEVTATLLDDHRVKLRNVPSYRAAKQVALEVESVGTVHGDIAWGGNWFFLVEDHGLPIAMRHLDALSDTAWRIRQALERAGITGDDGEEIDHIELFGPPSHPDAHSKSFVLCPGKAYDRSPCGTGTSAKLACLAADGKLAPGETWVQESVVGSTFEGQVEIVGDLLYPIITGPAWVSAESTLIFHPNDPFRKGIPSP